MEDEYAAWQKDPKPENMATLLTAANPVLDSALKSYAQGNPSLRGQAKKMAVGAFKTFDPKKGVKLRTHLLTQLQPLQRIARKNFNVTQMPERVSMDLYRLNQAHEEFKSKFSREPSDQELADKTNLSTLRITRLRAQSRSERSESGLTEVNEEGEEEMRHPGVETKDPHAIWMEYVHHDLSPLDQKILEWRTGYNNQPILPVGEVAKKLNLSAGAVSQRAGKIAKLLGQTIEV